MGPFQSQGVPFGGRGALRLLTLWHRSYALAWKAW